MVGPPATFGVVAMFVAQVTEPDVAPIGRPSGSLTNNIRPLYGSLTMMSKRKHSVVMVAVW